MQSVPSSSPAFGAGDRVSFWRQRSRFDQLGVVASCLCAVHCALGAVLVGVSSLAGSLFRDERLELVLLMGAAALAVAAVATGYRQHRDRRAVLFAVAGLSLLGVGRCIEASRLLEMTASVLGAALLVSGHVRNARLLHRLRTCCSFAAISAPPVAKDDPSKPADLGDSGFLTGEGKIFTGGYTSPSGTAKKPVEEPPPGPKPRPAPPPGPQPPDPSRPLGLTDDDWNCAWPHESDDQEINERVVVIRVVVGPDGSAESAQPVKDPGSGFGQAAGVCAEHAHFLPAHDQLGNAIRATSPPIRVRSTRSG